MYGLFITALMFALLTSSSAHAKSCISALSSLLKNNPKTSNSSRPSVGNKDLKQTQDLQKAWNRAYKKTVEAMRSHVFLSAVHKLDPSSFEIFARVSKDPSYTLSHFEKKWIHSKNLTERLESFRNTWNVVKGANWARAVLARHKPSDFTRRHSIPDGIITGLWQGLPNVFFSPILMPSRFFGSDIIQSRLDRIYRSTARKINFAIQSPEPQRRVKSTQDLLEVTWVDSNHQKKKLQRVAQLWTRFQNIQRKMQHTPTAKTNKAFNQLKQKIIDELGGLVSKEDATYLLSHGRLTDFIRFTEELKRYQTSYIIMGELKNIGKILRWSLIIAGTTLAASSLFEDEDDPQLNRDSVFDPEIPGALNPDDAIVELFFLSPMPHISLRVGGVVMDYGHGDATLSSLQEYKDSLVHSSTASFYRLEIKTTPEQFEAIQATVVEDSFRNYQYSLPFNNCVYQVNRVLCDAGVLNIPTAFNKSQALTLAYLKGLKLTNDPRIGSVSYVSLEDSTRFNDRLAFVGTTAIDTLFFGYHLGKNIVLSPFIKSHQKMKAEPEVP